MSLQTDSIFIQALSNSADIAGYVGDRIYSTAIPVPEKDLANVPVPYIIVRFDSLQNQAQTKDDYEGSLDLVDVSVVVAASDREELAQITELARNVIMDYFGNAEPNNEGFDLVPLDYLFTATAVQYDDEKPCFWQALEYQCDTKR